MPDIYPRVLDKLFDFHGKMLVGKPVETNVGFK